jgi:RNA-directed DNA polymerase
LVLEPIFEAEFYPSSYGYRPGRRAQDAIAEIHHFCKPSTYEWVIEGDIKACFDTVDHQRLMREVSRRVGDRKVLRLVAGFLRAGVVEQHGGYAATLTGTPQGGIISPLLANIYLSVLDRHFQHAWDTEMSPRWRRQKRNQKRLPNYRLVRFADDFVVLLHGSREDAERLRAEIAQLVATQLKMTLAVDKTHITHIDDGFDFLGFRIQRKPRGDGRLVVLTYPSKQALEAVKHKIKKATSRPTSSHELVSVLQKINPILRGLANYFRYGVSKRTFSYLGYYAWWRMILWLRRKHAGITWKTLRRRYYGADRIASNGVVLVNPAGVTVERYRYRGAQIATPWNGHLVDPAGARTRVTSHDDQAFLGKVSELLASPAQLTWRAGCGGSRTSGSAGGDGKTYQRRPARRPVPDPTPQAPLPDDRGRPPERHGRVGRRGQGHRRRPAVLRRARRTAGAQAHGRVDGHGRRVPH